MKLFTIVIALALIFITSYVSAPGVSSEGMTTLGIGLASLVLWNFVSLDWPSLFCLACLAIFSGLPLAEIFASGLGNWIIIYLMSCFMITHALNGEGSTRRLAILFVTNEIVRKKPWRFITFFCKR
jgi:sodium-dependent dicarboxylate transporter 2/3/5